MQTPIHEVIENSRLFAGLGDRLIDEIESSATRRMLCAGEILFQKGDPADALWGVLSGRVVVEVRTDDGKEMLLDTFGRGDVFGEVGVLDFGPRRVEARAAQQSELFRLERKHFLKHLQTSPELCFRVFSLLCSHLRETTENLEDTALYKLPNRLAKRLAMLADSEADHGTVVHIVQSELAGMLGVNREAVNRHLRAFEKDGLITLKRQQIEIVDQQALSELAAPRQANNGIEWGNGNLPAFARDTMSEAVESLIVRREPYSAGLMAVDAAEYSSSLMTDAAGTLKQIKAGLDAVDRAIEQNQGHTVWHAGDRVLAEFPDAKRAMDAALAIQEQVDPAIRPGGAKGDSLFRIGVHHGEPGADGKGTIGQAVNTAIRLTQLSGPGGIAISGAVRDALANSEQLEMQFLGDHELKNVSGAVPVYSARAVPLLKVLALRAETLVPRRYRSRAIAAAAIAIVAGIWFLGDRTGRHSAPLAVSELSIAILPFAAGEESPLAHLAQGIPHEIRSALSLIPGLRVIGQESSDYYRNRIASTSEVGRTLEVAWVLRGRIASNDDQIHTIAQLVSAGTGEVLWDEKFSGAGGDHSNVGSDISSRIAVSLGIRDDGGAGLVQLTPLTQDPDAHALYLEAQTHIWRGRNRNLVKAVPLLQAAVELDPKFAEAHAVLAGLYPDLDLLDDGSCSKPCPVGPTGEPFTPELRRMLSARSLQTALSLKPDSPLVLGAASQARVRETDWEGARALAERALRIDPNSTAALWALNWIYFSQGDWNGTLWTSEQLMRLEPLSVRAMGVYSSNLSSADRYQEALAVAERTLALYPEKDVPHFHAMMADSKLLAGDRVGAIESSLKGLPYSFHHLWAGLDNDWDFVDEFDSVRAVVTLVYVGEYDRVRQALIDDAMNVEPDSRFGINSTTHLINLGELEVLAGNYDEAIEIFARARPLLKGDDVELFWSTHNHNAYLSWSRKSSPALALLYACRQTGRDEMAEEIADLIRRGIAGRRRIHDAVGARGEFRLLYREAQLMAIEGPADAGLTALRRWREHDPEQFNYPRNDPFLSNLHSEPEFWEIIAELEADLAQTRLEYFARL